MLTILTNDDLKKTAKLKHKKHVNFLNNNRDSSDNKQHYISKNRYFNVNNLSRSRKRFSLRKILKESC